MSGRSDAAFMPSAAIAAGAAVSGAVEVKKLAPRGLCVRANWTDWTTADLGIQASFDGGDTYNDLWQLNSAGDGYERVKCLSPGAISGIADYDAIEVPVAVWMIENATHIRFASRNTSNYATPVNQSNAITLYLGTLA